MPHFNLGVKSEGAHLKTIAVICNIFLLLVAIYIVSTEGRPTTQKDWLIFLVLFVAPISSLLAFWGRIDELWPFVYFQRKALEEKKKIEALNAGRKP